VTERWQNAVEETLPQANRLTLEQLRDELPVTLEQMALALEASDPKPTKDLMTIAMEHGEARFDQNFNLAELMIEYCLLRPIIIDEVAAYLGRVITMDEIAALNMGVD